MQFRFANSWSAVLRAGYQIDCTNVIHPPRLQFCAHSDARSLPDPTPKKSCRKKARDLAPFGLKSSKPAENEKLNKKQAAFHRIVKERKKESQN